MGAHGREFLNMRHDNLEEHKETPKPSKEYLIRTAKICPYCGSGVSYTTEYEIYSRTFKDRKVVKCNNYPKCDSYVGCHEDGRPLGRLANRKLRKAKKQCHALFDRLWMPIAHIEGVQRFTRKEAYAWLSEKMELHPEYTHIGMFDLEQCEKAINFIIRLLYPNE